MGSVGGENVREFMNMCSVCGEPVKVAEDKTNVCTVCTKVFCEKHNTVGNQWNGKDSKTEHLSEYCEECAVDYISGEADYWSNMMKDKRLGVRVNVDEIDKFR